MALEDAKVYVGTYKKYNEGSIKGGWLNLPDYFDKDEFINACKLQHIDECECPACGMPVEDGYRNDLKCTSEKCMWEGDIDEARCEAELMFQDWECIPEGLISECTISENIWGLINALDGVDTDAFEAFLKLRSYDLSDEDPDDIVENFNDQYFTYIDGHYDKNNLYKKFGEYVVDNGLFGIDIPDSLVFYIDHEAIGRDWMMDYSEQDGYIFRD